MEPILGPKQIALASRALGERAGIEGRFREGDGLLMLARAV
jgi:hypothetical protein